MSNFAFPGLLPPPMPAARGVSIIVGRLRVRPRLPCLGERRPRLSRYLRMEGRCPFDHLRYAELSSRGLHFTALRYAGHPAQAPDTTLPPLGSQGAAVWSGKTFPEGPPGGSPAVFSGAVWYRRCQNFRFFEILTILKFSIFGSPRESGRPPRPDCLMQRRFPYLGYFF